VFAQKRNSMRQWVLFGAKKSASCEEPYSRISFVYIWLEFPMVDWHYAVRIVFNFSEEWLTRG